MKITPMTGAGNPGADLNSITTNPAPSSRIENAKAIARGESPMRLAPSDTPVDPQVQRAQANIRKIKMQTQVSHNRPIESPELMAPDEPAISPQSAISDISETTTASEETRPLSPQFAALAKARRALQVKEREIAEREKALESQGSQGPTGVPVDRLKADPLGVLLEAGVTFEQLTDAVINGPPANAASAEIMRLKAEIESLKTGIDSKFTERDTLAEQQVLAEIRREADQLVSGTDDFKYVRAMKTEGAAVELVKRTFKETGEMLDIEEALKLVNEECRKDFEALSQALTPAERMQQQQQMQNQSVGMRTLTNRDNARPVMSKRDRAMAAFYGTLKE